MMAGTASVPGRGIPFVCSWSGGKDSCLALHRAVASGADPAFLLSMLCADGTRSRSHGLRPAVLQAQSAAVGIPLVTRRATWSQYEDVFVSALRDLRARGIEAGVFGDIDLDDHRRWEEKVCNAAGIEAHLPLWKAPRWALLDQFLALGYEATVVATSEQKLGSAYLGRTLDGGLVQDFQRIGIDLSGEVGEYHTVVTGGPLFSGSLELEAGATSLHSKYWFLDVYPPTSAH